MVYGGQPPNPLTVNRQLPKKDSFRFCNNLTRLEIPIQRVPKQIYICLCTNYVYFMEYRESDILYQNRSSLHVSTKISMSMLTMQSMNSMQVQLTKYRRCLHLFELIFQYFRCNNIIPMNMRV